MAPPDSRPEQMPPALIAAVERAINELAAMAAVCLKVFDEKMKLPGRAKGAAGLPIQFFVEIAAVLQIRAWEETGLHGSLSPRLPSYAEAAADLHRRARTAPEDFIGADGLQLSPIVIIASVQQFAWAASNLLQADFVLGQIEEDALVDALATLLWNYRHD
jgi:hypothetical protein